MKAIVIHQYGGPDVLKFEENSRSGRRTGRSRGASGRRQHQSNRHHRTLWRDEGLQADDVSERARMGPRGNDRQHRASGPGFLPRRQSARLGLSHLRRTLRREAGASGQGPGRPRPGRGRCLAAGDDNRRRAHLGRGWSEGRADRAGLGRVGRRRPLGGLHRQGAWRQSDRGGPQEPDGGGKEPRRGPGRGD